MIVTETKSQHCKEVTKLGGTVYDKSGYRMDVNLWFRHKNEALFYIDSVGRVHGPMDQTYSTRLGPVQKSGREIAFRREFNEQTEKDQWQKSMEFQRTQPTEIRHETKHFETILRDVSSNEMNNHKKSHLTLSNHYIPSYKNAETCNYSTTLTKQNKKPDQGVTVNIIAPPEVSRTNFVEKETSTTTRERRLIDELLEAREELNSLRRTKSVIDNRWNENDSKNYYNSTEHVSKVVTDVYPSTHSIEKVKKRHHSTHQESSNKTSPGKIDSENYQTKQTVYGNNQRIEPTQFDKTFYSEIRNRYGLDKQPGQQIPITIQTGNRSKNETETVTYNNSNNQSFREISPVQRVDNISLSQFSNGNAHDLVGEEKTVTIKRKITKRKKGSESVNVLRDSYIDKIDTSPQLQYDSTSESDNDRKLPEIKEAISPLKNAQLLEQIIPHKEINEEAIAPVKSASKLEQFKPLKEVAEEQIVPIKTKPRFEFQKTPDWDYRDNTITRGQTPLSQRNNISDTTTYNTYIQEKDSGPISNYSARKENLRTQQMMGERNGSLRTLPMERRVNEMTEEIETITLQPIGKGVQDLAPAIATLSRPGSRAATPRAYETSRSNFFREESKQTAANYNTMPAMPRFNKYSSNKYTSKEPVVINSPSPANRSRLLSSGNFTNARNINQNSSYDIPDSYKRVGSVGRSGHEQVVNTSWQTRTETYSGGNRNPQATVLPMSNQESMMSANYAISGGEESQYPLQFVLNTEELWYQPQLNREEVINALRDKEPGSFIIRNSSTFVGAYGLALKVSSLPDNAVRTNDIQGDLIRHFLIETVEESGNSGVRLKGLANEPIYPSLAHLVQDHCHNPRSLPTKLIISSSQSIRMDHMDGGMAQSQYHYESNQKQQIGSSRAQMLSTSHRSMSSPGVNFIDINHPNPLHQCLVTKALYLGKFDVDRLDGKPAVEQAVNKLLNKKNPKTTTVEIKLDSTNGITLTDKVQFLFYTRQFPAQHVLSAEFDAQLREFSSPILQNNGINRGRIIGIVVRKNKIILRENSVHLFCELDKSNDVNNIITFIKENYLRRA